MSEFSNDEHYENDPASRAADAFIVRIVREVNAESLVSREEVTAQLADHFISTYIDSVNVRDAIHDGIKRAIHDFPGDEWLRVLDAVADGISGEVAEVSRAIARELLFAACRRRNGNE